jgi:phospholipid/cholesterol/gamma-HCH transport system substrate-binding protein
MSKMNQGGLEVGAGLVVLALSGAFLAYGLEAAGPAGSSRGYDLTAKFGEAGSLAPGAAVSVAGVKVGTVAQITLDPKTYMAVARLSIDPNVKLPADSTAKITSDSLLGGAHVSIAPGAAMDDIKPGGEIDNTQGAVDIFGLIGSAIRPQAPAATPAPSTSTPAESD